jgi:D-inositol-3-phosphate glycosyltransferase
MSSVKMTRLFAQKGYPSFEICEPGSPIQKALQEQNLEAKTVPSAKYFSPAATWQVRRWIQESNVRAIFLHHMKDIWLVRPALYGMPEVKLFGFARMFFKNVNKKDLLHSHLYGRLDKMIALSHIQQGFLQNCLPVGDAHFTVIPNGVDTERFRPRPKRQDIRAAWGVGPENTLFCLIGRLDKQKGSLEFVEAAAQVIAANSQARFVLVGGNTLGEGEFDLLVRERLKSLNLADKVLLTDFRKDIPEVMNALDVFVMPSYEENFGNVLLEALASGLPTIGTNSGGTPEILDQGKTGLLCEPRSADALAQAMLKIMQPAVAADLSQRARTKAEHEYDMNRVFERIEALVTN